MISYGQQLREVIYSDHVRCQGWDGDINRKR